MTRVGDVTIPTPMGHESILYVGLNVLDGPNASSLYYIGSYTMPMTGRLSASLYVQCSWAGQAQEVTGVLADSSPAPADGFGFDISLNGVSRTVVGTGHLMYRWPVMVAGTVVALYMRIRTSFFSANVTTSWVYGWLRSYRTDT